jgi:transcriptional regulator
MFVPSDYRVTDDGWLCRVIRGYPLATLVTNGSDLPLSTHLPVIAESETPSRVGATLFGHMNRANPHWQSLVPGQAARLIFAGPHGYISPSVYQTTPAAPTWNFASVHLCGTLELLGVDQVIEVVRRTVATFEPAFGAGWEPEESLRYFDRIAPGVGAFRFTVVAVHGQYKFSQDKDAQTQERVIDWFARSPSGTGRDLADLMRSYGLGWGNTASD